MWKTDVHGILLHPTEAKVWLLADARGCRLPGFTFTHAKDPYLACHFDGALIPGFREIYGCGIYTMRTASEHSDPKNQRAGVVCILEIREGHPITGEWVDAQTTSSRSFVVPEHEKLVRRTFSELEEEEATSLRQPWRCRGWYKDAVQWIEQELPRLGYGPVTDIEQGRPAILRAHTGRGVFYFKAITDAWYVNEPVIADTLGTRYPHLIPRPVCIDAERRWMLTPEFGPTLGDPPRDREMLMKAASAYGQMQLDSAAHMDDLLKPDTFGFDLDRLPSTVEKYVRESAVMKLLKPDEVSALQNHLPLLNEYIRQLADSPIPQTLVHGDLGPYNIARRGGGPVIFDWTTATISFPFFDVVELIHRTRSPAGGTPAHTPDQGQREMNEIRQQVKEAYLSAWTELASVEELEAIWKIAEPLGFLSMALHLPYPYFPRRVLRYLEEA